MKSNLATWAGGSGDFAAEPVFDSVEELRSHRKRQTALSYRLFGAFGWGTLGDGHITARDPERTDCFWLLRYGVSFRDATVDDLVLVGPGGQVVEGEGPINMTAYYIHGPIHDARPEAVSVAHTHTPYATPWMANVRPFRMICQEATAFFRSQAIFEGEEVQVMDADTGKHIAAALDEARVAGQRMADALAGLVTREDTNEDGKPPRGPRLLLIADYDVINRELQNGRLGDGTPIPIEKIRDLACQSDILPGIFRGVSQPLDLGRSRRAASPAQRVALVARDKACVGCGANANWCQSHHIIPWAVQGNTDIDGMCLLCSRCHHKVHDDHWVVRKTPTGKYHLKPPRNRSTTTRRNRNRPSRRSPIKQRK